jgi:multidrug efflux pump subunit AcrA (membrane-fusion protein)
MIPSEEIGSTSESILSQTINKVNVFFWLSIAFVFSIICVIFYFNIDITVASSGIIRPAIEKIEIRPLVNVSAERVFVVDGDNVEKGDTLLTLDKRQITSRLQLLTSQKENVALQLNDLRLLLAGSYKTLKTTIYTTLVAYISVLAVIL